MTSIGVDAVTIAVLAAGNARLFLEVCGQGIVLSCYNLTAMLTPIPTLIPTLTCAEGRA